MSADPELEPRRRGIGVPVGQVVRRYWLLIAATALLAAAIAAALALSRGPTYRATVQLVFTPPGPEFGVLGLTPTGGDPAREAATNVVRVGSRIVAAAAARELREPSVEALRSRILVTTNPDTNVVDVSAEDGSPEGARRTAIVYAETFQAQQRSSEVERARAARRVLEERYGDLSARARRTERGLRLRDQIEQLAVLEQIGTGSPRLLGVPEAATRVDDSKQLIVLGGLLGLVLGTGLAFLRAASDSRLRDDDELAAVSSVPVLGTIPRSASLRRDSRFSELPTEEAEAFRRLYARLRFAEEPPRVLVVTSARAGEGKTTVATHLAAAGASSGDRVLLVEADLRRPSVARRLRLSPQVGLIQMLEGRVEPIAATASTSPDPRVAADGGGCFEVLDSGGASEHAPALLRSPAMDRLFAAARRSYDVVVVDTPAVGPVADAIPLLRHADGVLLSTLVGHSDRDETLRLVEELTAMGSTVLGIVVNGGERGEGSPYYVAPADAARAAAARAPQVTPGDGRGGATVR